MAPPRAVTVAWAWAWRSPRPRRHLHRAAAAAHSGCRAPSTARSDQRADPGAGDRRAVSAARHARAGGGRPAGSAGVPAAHAGRAGRQCLCGQFGRRGAGAAGRYRPPAVPRDADRHRHAGHGWLWLGAHAARGHGRGCGDPAGGGGDRAGARR
ncbi:hypothetical protein G6F46_013983 [Rhizopus delemar]|nr:hypothetical protein G6F24_016540 [Rhizopus arrhizus]KAG1601015.1 hypothetical protein G6F46_013983 [Rhizopus delemar]